MEIWRVARAATAAPLYFTEIKFKTKSMAGATNVYFSDGGFGHINNPTNLGLQEIQSLHGSNNIGVLVSVGTARADDQPGGKSIFKRVKSFANAATDPRIVAEQLHGRDLYWRFNDEKGLDIELDDWKPNGWFTKNPGRDTLTKIENEFNHWARKRENIRQLEECARELVRRRRRRTEDRSKWEHYATGAQFRCMHDICESRPYNLRAEFEEHRRKEHPDSTPNDETHDPIITIWKYQGPEKP
jgi:hypothetical protein